MYDEKDIFQLIRSDIVYNSSILNFLVGDSGSKRAIGLVCLLCSLFLFEFDSYSFVLPDNVPPQVAGETSTLSVQDIVYTAEERAWQEQHPVIRVSNEFDWPPFDFVVSGAPQGYGIDLMELLSERSGLSFEYINGYTWDELIEMFFLGQIDLVHSLSVTPERQEKAFFSPPYYHSKNVLILRNHCLTQRLVIHRVFSNLLSGSTYHRSGKLQAGPGICRSRQGLCYG